MGEHDTTWRILLEEELARNGETVESITATTLSDGGLDRVFNNDFWFIEGEPFTAWSADYVYFPIAHDGLESVASVPRNPDRNARPTKHIGY